MMKRISYVLLLFIMISIIGNVKALTICHFDNGETYRFNDNGEITSFEAENKKHYKDYNSPTEGGNDIGLMEVYGKYTASVPENYSPVKYANLLSLATGSIKPGVCPTIDEINADVDTNNDCTVHIASKYYCRTGLKSNCEQEVDGCYLYLDYDSCTRSDVYSCLWVSRSDGAVLRNGALDSTKAYCNVDNLQYVQCGNSFDIPAYLPRIISFVINLLKIVTPIILVFTSAITLLKAITASKEDEMNKAKSTLVRRIVLAALIFFTMTITQFVINRVADGEDPENISECLDCFINNSCGSKYYKNNINGEYQCFYINGDDFDQTKCH